MQACNQQGKENFVVTLTTVSFVWSIEAVSSSVTFPTAMDALSTATAELQRWTVVGRRRRMSPWTTVLGPFVWAVEAVGVTVTGPQARNADGVVALEGRRVTGSRWARGLITAIVTVCFVIAHEWGWHALAIPTAELCVCALLGR